MSGTPQSAQDRKPLGRDVTEELHKLLFITGPAGFEDLPGIIDKAQLAKDHAAEAIARFRYGYMLDNHKEKPTEAIAQYNRVLKLYPAWMDARFNRGVAQVHSNQFDEAIGDFNEAESLLSSEGPPDGSGEYAARELLWGKLLLFRAQARVGTKLPNEINIARDEILRAQSHLKFGGAEGEFWSRQIGQRLKDTYAAAEQPHWLPRPHLGSGVLFWLGVVVAAVLLVALWFLILSFQTDTSVKASRNNVGNASDVIANSIFRDTLPKLTTQTFRVKGLQVT